MEGSILGGPILSAPTAGGLELDPTLQFQSLHHQQALSHHLQGLAPLSTTQQLNFGQTTEQSLLYEQKGTPRAGILCCKGKSTGTSDDEEPSFTEEGDCHLGGKGKKSSPWQRIKWTDGMVKLLINVVLFVGEDGTGESTDGNKRKSGILQKKGKWKSVSCLMNERGCYVSPQQCEDKFNDLNKRYKRLNDILGKGTACHVVENPSLMDTMDNLSSKMKDDVRKILSSKHLFYREMCAYHNGCKSVVLADLEFQPSLQIHNGKNKDDMEFGRSDTGVNDIDEDDEDDLDDDDDDDDNEEDDSDDDHTDMRTEVPHDFTSFGKQRILSKQFDGSSNLLSSITKNAGSEHLNADLLWTTQDETNWTGGEHYLFKTRLLQLQEQKINLQAQALELEKQRFNWQKASVKKDRDLERMRLDNKKMKLENERMSLNLKQRELEVECKRSEASMTSIDLVLERLQTKEKMESAAGEAS